MSRAANKPDKPIAYTIGEPAGIGADIILQLAQTIPLHDIVIVGDQQLLTQRARQLGMTVPNSLRIEHIALADISVSAIPNIKNVSGVMAMLDHAIDGCMHGDYSGMVTGPINKAVINEAGVAFSGHTEYLAERTGADLPVMMLAAKALRVALITTHLPLKDVSEAITGPSIIKTCEIIHRDLQLKFGIEKPTLLVCGLNPHAGESGYLGMEEINVITPALQELREREINVLGPLPADTIFTAKYLSQADVVVAMYHDQGLPVLKSQGFGEAANITLGLPIIRASVDHGTAFDLTGSGLADTGSLTTAIQVVRQMLEVK